MPNRSRILFVMFSLATSTQAFASDDPYLQMTADAVAKYERQLVELTKVYAAGDYTETANKLRGAIDASGDFVRYGRELQPASQSSREYSALVARMAAANKSFAKLAGGHALEVIGDGQPAAEPSEKAMKEVEEALDQCGAVGSYAGTMSTSDAADLAKLYQSYEKQLAKAKQIDANAFRARAVPAKLAACELQATIRKTMLEDVPSREDSSSSTHEECGWIHAGFQQLQLARGGFGPLEFAGYLTGQYVGTPIACKEIPKKSKASKAVLAAAKKTFNFLKDWTLVVDDTQMIPTSDNLQVYKVTGFKLYSTMMTVKKTDCGSMDRKVVCEASGSQTVAAYNRISHYGKRAELHKKAGRSVRCGDMLQEMMKAAKDWQSFYENAQRSGKWAKGLKYQTRYDGTLDEDGIVAKVKAQGEQADQRDTASWCSK